MTCSCGHHHNSAPCPDDGTPIALETPLIALTGSLICADAAQMMTALDLLPEHTRLSRTEPGCLRFDLAQDDDPLIWTLSELFADKAAFAAHGTRMQTSEWGQKSQDITRDFNRMDAIPYLRNEQPQDRPAIHALNRAAFGGNDEADLVDRLRSDGDLDLSLVAAQGGTVLGHIALSPVSAPFPALALAPVAVHPALHRRGIGAALIRAAIAARPGHAIVVLGDPAYYMRFGFAPVAWNSPYAGPYLQALGPDLPQRAAIAHAPAFGG